MGNNKKTVGTNKQHQTKKEYEKQLKNGTEVKISINIEAKNFKECDFEEMLSEFAISSHNFYLQIAKNMTALEVPVQEQYIKTNEIHIDATDFEKIVALLGVMIKPIDFTNKFKIVVNYNPNNPKIELNYFKSE